VEESGIDPLLGDGADGGGLHARQVELARECGKRIAAVRIRRPLQVIADQLQLAVARTGVDERV
jgi:hypothetical protein